MDTYITATDGTTEVVELKHWSEDDSRWSDADWAAAFAFAD